MADLIRLRRGTSSQWTEVDPVLDPGEPGFETDSGCHKIGDGATPWSELPYFLDEPALERWYASHPPTYVTSTPDGLVVNVQDPAYGAVGDGATDDTAAIQAAIDATAGGGTCFFPPGTYAVGSTGTSILTGRGGVTLAGAGASTTTIRVATDSSSLRVLNLSRCSDVSVRDLGFDATGNAEARSAIYASARNGQRNLWVRRCRFAAFMPGDTTSTYAAVYVWTSDGVHVLDNEFAGCGRAVTIDQPDGVARVVGNRIAADDPQQMATGIFLRRASGVSESDVVVSDNVVTGARLDPGGVGAEGHGIAVYRCQDVQVTNNHLSGNGRGVLVSDQSFGTVVQGNTCVGNADAGIRCEPEISSKVTGAGTGAERGVVVIGNVCRHNESVGAPSGANSGIGIAMSYAAGSVVSGNVVHHNTGDGIFCDSDRVAILGNVVYSNFTGYVADPTTGRRGGIRLIVGTGCTVVGNQCFDNQEQPTQHYGLSLSTAGVTHVVHGNNFGGNSVGEVWGADKIGQGFFGATPVPRPVDPGTANGLNNTTVINNVVSALRDLGLIG